MFDRQGAVLERVGRQLVQRQRYGLRRLRPQGDRRTGQVHPFVGIGRQFVAQQALKVGARPLGVGQQRVGAGHGLDAPVDGFGELLRVFGAGQVDDGLDHHQGVLGPVIDFPHQQLDAFLTVAPFGDVGGHAHHQPAAVPFLADRSGTERPDALLAFGGADHEFAFVDRLVQLEEPFDVRPAGGSRLACRTTVGPLHPIVHGRQLFPAVPGDFQPCPADMKDLAVLRMHDHGERRSFHDTAQAVALLLHLSLGGPPRGDVAHDAGKEPLPVASAPFGDRKLQREKGAVLAASLDLAADADDPPHSRSAIVADIAVVTFAMFIARQHGHVPADQFRFRIAEGLGGGRIDGLDDALVVDHHHGIDRRFENRPMLAFAGLQGALARVQRRSHGVEVIRQAPRTRLHWARRTARAVRSPARRRVATSARFITGPLT